MNKLKQKLKKIKLLVVDVDGVLTDGTIALDSTGHEFKNFNAHDGAGLKLLGKTGVKLAIISGRHSKCTDFRSLEIGIDDVYQGIENKTESLDELIEKYSLTLDEIAYMGDDLFDLPVLNKVGFSCAPADAVEDVRKRVLYVCSKQGGKGAVREVTELIIKAQDNWEKVLELFNE
jgi:3-deoxy-D-manno-octulosonate 8-phosphate phosphatase (KDO 8-P phosphatase)